MNYAVTNSPENCEAMVACGGLKVVPPSVRVLNCNSHMILMNPTITLVSFQTIFPVFMGRASAQRLNKTIRKRHGGQGKTVTIVLIDK